MKCDANGHGYINILAADKLMASPRLYASFLLWLLSELFETLPEVGDPDKPKLVFFFDEAHLLFDDAPKALVDKVEQVARLIRSKGVGVYFVTQNPADIPDDILGQLGNRVQHALRAYTAKDQKALRLAAETYRDNPRFSTEKAILEVGVGEAVTSFLIKKGAPGVVERTLIRPPSTQLGPISDDERRAILARSHVAGKYETPIDRISAHEILLERAKQAASEAELAEERALADEQDQIEEAREYRTARRYSGSRVTSNRVSTTTSSRRRKSPDSMGEAIGQALVKELAGTTGRRIIRGILGGFFKAR
jgi:DNA helicase HerA-like ATPase